MFSKFLQMNTLTAFLDASHLYGSSEAEARELREGTGGLLKVILRAMCNSSRSNSSSSFDANNNSSSSSNESKRSSLTWNQNLSAKWKPFRQKQMTQNTIFCLIIGLVSSRQRSWDAPRPERFLLLLRFSGRCEGGRDAWAGRTPYGAAQVANKTLKI